MVSHSFKMCMTILISYSELLMRFSDHRDDLGPFNYVVVRRPVDYVIDATDSLCAHAACEIDPRDLSVDEMELLKFVIWDGKPEVREIPRWLVPVLSDEFKEEVEVYASYAVDIETFVVDVLRRKSFKIIPETKEMRAGLRLKQGSNLNLYRRVKKDEQ